jgi:prepilin-type N-terminal cleavage/methylation domain-containing protein
MFIKKLTMCGFTLVELMAVIVILGILSVVIVPKIGDSISSSKNKAYQVQVVNIKKGVSDFLVDNGDIINDGESVTFTLGVVKQGGYLPIDIKNPLTKKNFSNESNINVSKTNGIYSIELNLFDMENYNSNIDSNSPIIILNGNYIEYVDVFSDYQELGATAQDYMGQSLVVASPQYVLGDVNQSSINTSNLGTYSAIYSVSDSSGNRSSATRTIIVRDNEAPIITVPSTTNISLSEFSGFDLKSGLSVSDNYDGVISNTNVTVTSNLASRVGTYVATYRVEDSSHNVSEVRRVIHVVD